MYRTIDKYWGIEDWISVTDSYAFKRLTIQKGKTLLNHYHNIKEETFYISKGNGVITINGIEHHVFEGDSIHLTPKIRHQIYAISDLVILEASSPHLEDSIREELICL